MDEYIARDAVHCMMVGLTKYVWTSPVSTESHVTVDADDVNFGVDKIPAADVAPVRHGQWYGEGDGYAETEDGEMALVYDVWNCSECGYTIDDGTDDPDLLPNYCPHCGAKMDGKVGDNA